MDYSTISNKTSCTEIEDLTNSELSEQYYSLKKQYDNLCTTLEATKQELHDTRRGYQTALDVQNHLSTELEAYQAGEGRRRNDLSNKLALLQEEISTLRDERTEAAKQHDSEVKKLEADIRRLKEERARVNETPLPDAGELDELRAALSSALSDFGASKAALDAAQADAASWRAKGEEMLAEMQDMRRVAEVRRGELCALREREAAAQAELADARAALCRVTDPAVPALHVPHAAKGNSIFAEVEDKRQEMAKNLIQMKQTNSRLRRDLANKQSELEALLHEKQTVWEQQTGASAHYDRELIESYEERITQLESLCERQRRELGRWFSKLAESGPRGWLSGVLDHLKSECSTLREEVLSRGAAQLALAAQVRDLRRKLAFANTNHMRTSHPSPEMEQGDVIQSVIPAKKVLDEVKKKVSFN